MKYEVQLFFKGDYVVSVDADNEDDAQDIATDQFFDDMNGLFAEIIDVEISK